MFYRICPNSRGFLGKIWGFGGEMREKRYLMSGAAARTGEFKENKKRYIKKGEVVKGYCETSII